MILPVFAALAQDVSVTPIDWIVIRGAPDELPTFKHKPEVRFPPELRDTAEIGYVAVESILDDKGRSLSTQKHATLAVLARATEPTSAASPTFTPGRREGKPVVTSIVYGIIFNPASATATGPNATPRLLDFTLVHVPAPKTAGREGVVPDQIVFADVSIDAAGAVTAVKNAPAELAVRLGNAAKQWKFAPARRDGQAVAAEIRVPFVVVTGLSSALAGKLVPPRVTRRSPPIYPAAMLRSGMRGEVLVDFVVDIEGRVQNAFVVRSLNPAFDDPAIESVRSWRFQPGTKGGVPVTTHLQVPILFQIERQRDGGEDGMVVRKKGDMSKLPEELRYDTPPRLTGSVRPVYPYVKLIKGEEGKASVSFLINERGQVIDAKVTSATAPEFGLALLAAVEQFTYEPALKNNRPSQALAGFTQEFKRDIGSLLVGYDDFDLLRREQKKPQSIAGPADLDSRVTPRSRRPPRFPLAHRNDGQPGKAEVEVLVDEDGRVRLPRIVSATDDSFGYAAVQGVVAWRFEPATRAGRPVAIRARISIEFNLPTPPTAGKE